MNTSSFYDQWIDWLKKDVPSLENQEEMTASIMEKVENLPVNAFSKPIRYWTTFLSGAVACGLFCLLIHEFNNPLINMPDRPVTSAVKKNLLPENMEEIPDFLKEKERRATVYSELRLRLSQNYIHLAPSDM